MAARTADAATPILQFPVSFARDDRSAVADSEQAQPDRPLGAFRGLAFAILFECLAGFMGYAGWQLFCHLR